MLHRAAPRSSITGGAPLLGGTFSRPVGQSDRHWFRLEFWQDSARQYADASWLASSAQNLQEMKGRDLSKSGFLSKNITQLSSTNTVTHSNLFLKPASQQNISGLRLFMSIAGGLSWEDALTPLRGVSALAVIFMVIFIVITVFAVPW